MALEISIVHGKQKKRRKKGASRKQKKRKQRKTATESRSRFSVYKMSKSTKLLLLALIVIGALLYYFNPIYSTSYYKTSHADYQEWNRKGQRSHPMNNSLERRLELDDKVELMLEDASQPALTEHISDATDDTNILSSTSMTSTNGPTTIKSSALKRRLEVDEQVEILLEKSSEQMNILVYQLPFKPDPYMIDPDRKRCGNCRILWDKSLINHPDTKAVLFYFDQFPRHGFPENSFSSDQLRGQYEYIHEEFRGIYRNLDQLWGFWTREAPPASKYTRGLTFDKYDHFFNFTMSFRRDADIWDPYETSTTILTEIIRQADGRDRKEIIDEQVANKKKLASWVVSNCGLTPGARVRLKFAQSLVNSGLKLDRRGNCFHSKVPNIREFISEYKFYLAFENSHHCRDYITEKLTQNALMTGAVPVVYGATKSDLIESMPPNSFIYADDFNSPEELTDYLNYLDQHDDEYKKYLMWRTLDYKDMPTYKREANFCQLCRVLHGIHVDNLFNSEYETRFKDKQLFGRDSAPRVFPSIQDWYYGSENAECWK